MGNTCSYSDQEDPDNYTILAQGMSDFDARYLPGSVIGHGEFSEVKKAEGPQGPVAVKCIRLSTIRNDLHLLKREICIMHKIRHPNVVQLYEIYEDEEFFFITMELCEDGNLRQKVKHEGPLAIGEVKIIARKLLAALEYLHSHNICHRDIKPENILFKNDEPKLADFGLARLMSDTQRYSMVGTPYYLAPEVISGEYNFKCDIWSLGVVLFFALTGEKPFVAEGYEELFEKIKDTEIVWDQVPEDAQDFLRYLLKKNHKIRPTAHEALIHQWLQ